MRATELCPRLVSHGRRVTARLIGRLYDFNGQKNRARVFAAIDARVSFENYVETGTSIPASSTAAASRSPGAPLTLAHYWIDGFLWRFRTPARRAWLARSYPFLGGASGAAASAPRPALVAAR